MTGDGPKRSMVELMVLMVTATVCAVLVLLAGGIAVIEIVNPEADTGAGVTALTSVVTTLTGAVLGLIAGHWTSGMPGAAARRADSATPTADRGGSGAGRAFRRRADRARPGRPSTGPGPANLNRPIYATGPAPGTARRRRSPRSAGQTPPGRRPPGPRRPPRRPRSPGPPRHTAPSPPRRLRPPRRRRPPGAGGSGRPAGSGGQGGDERHRGTRPAGRSRSGRAWGSAGRRARPGVTRGASARAGPAGPPGQ